MKERSVLMIHICAQKALIAERVYRLPGKDADHNQHRNQKCQKVGETILERVLGMLLSQTHLRLSSLLLLLLKIKKLAEYVVDNNDEHSSDQLHDAVVSAHEIHSKPHESHLTHEREDTRSREQDDFANQHSR